MTGSKGSSGRSSGLAHDLLVSPSSVNFPLQLVGTQALGLGNYGEDKPQRVHFIKGENSRLLHMLAPFAQNVFPSILS